MLSNQSVRVPRLRSLGGEGRGRESAQPLERGARVDLERRAVRGGLALGAAPGACGQRLVGCGSGGGGFKLRIQVQVPRSQCRTPRVRFDWGT